MMGTESVAEYLKRWPGALAFLGVGSETDGALGTVMHNPKFDIDESALKLGSLASARFALAALGQEDQK
jgi:metal-dependent amidase/aminoacylase/carboxypeptidase family protein